MQAVSIVRRTVRFVFRSLLIPFLLAASFLGVTSGGRGTVSIAPMPTDIVAELRARHDLPKGTRLTLGDPAKPTTVTYDDEGRLIVTPPRGETFGTILAHGFDEMGKMAGDAGIDVAHADTATRSALPRR